MGTSVCHCPVAQLRMDIPDIEVVVVNGPPASLCQLYQVIIVTPF